MSPQPPPDLTTEESALAVLYLLSRIAWHGLRPATMSPLTVAVPVGNATFTFATLDALERVALKESQP